MEKYAEIALRSPFLHTPMAAAPGPASSSQNESLILWGERQCSSLWCLKQVYFSLNTGNNLSSYHCCLFKPLDNLMLCLLLVPIGSSPGLCGEILSNAFIFLVLFPLILCMYDANLLSFSFFLLFCIFLPCVSYLLSLGILGLSPSLFCTKISFNVVCSSFVNQLKFFFNKKACLWCVERIGNGETMDITSYTEPGRGFQLHCCTPTHANQHDCPTLNSQVDSVMTRSVCHDYVEMWRTKRNGAAPNFV